MILETRGGWNMMGHCDSMLLKTQMLPGVKILPNLWFTTILSQGAQAFKKPDTPQASKSSSPCFRWNDVNCFFPRCRYAHLCSTCQGLPRKINCEQGVQASHKARKDWSPSPPPTRSPTRNDCLLLVPLILYIMPCLLPCLPLSTFPLGLLC